MDNREFDFIARHYRKGRFSPDAGWRRLGIAPAYHRVRLRVAAAVAATVILSATAAIMYRQYSIADSREHVVTPPAASPLAEVKVIDFENAPLAEVTARIEAVYNVRVENLPDNMDGYSLSLHYEGTPTDLVGVINDILGTQMYVTEK